MSRAERLRSTRARLLDAAAEGFARHGFHAATVDDVAEAAGFTKGAVYAHFSSKEELFLTVIDRQIEEDFDWFASLFQIEGDADLLAALAARAERRGTENGAWLLLSMEFWLYAVRRPPVAAALAARYQTLRARLADHLSTQYATEGAVPPLRTDHLATALIGLSNGLALQHALDPAAAPSRLFAAAAFRLVAGDITATPSEDAATWRAPAPADPTPSFKTPEPEASKSEVGGAGNPSL